MTPTNDPQALIQEALQDFDHALGPDQDKEETLAGNIAWLRLQRRFPDREYCQKVRYHLVPLVW